MVNSVALVSLYANGDGEGLIKFSYFGIRKRSDEMRQTSVQLCTLARSSHRIQTGVLETFIDTYGDLG